MKQPLAVIVSDLHAGLRLPHAKISPDSTTSDRLEDVLDIIKQVETYVSDHSVPNVFIAGDLFDQRHPDAPTLVRTAQALGDLGDETRHGVGILPGNHDAHDRAGKVYSVDLFNALESSGLGGRVYSLNTPDFNPYPINQNIEPIHVIAIPWLPDKLFRERVHEIVDDGLPDGKNVLLFHQSVAGATEGTYEAKGDITPKLFEPFDLAVSGHIHEPQKIGRVQYLGSPLHLRFTDAGQARGFWVLYDDLSFEMVPTTFPPFVRWRFLSDEDYTAAEIVKEHGPSMVEELKPDTYLDIVIESERDDAEEATRLVRSMVDEDSLRMVRISAVYIDDGASERVREAASAPGSVATPEELIEAVVEASSTKWPEGVTREELIEFGRGVIR